MQLREHEGVQSKADMFRVDPRSLLVESGFNVRDFSNPDARERLDELKESIRSDGVLVPLEIRLHDDNLFVVSGHRRLTAVMELISEGVEIKSVPAIAEPKSIGAEDRTVRLLTLNGGEPLAYAEKAEVVRRLLGYGWDRQKIAQRAGWSAQTVANFEEYLAAHPEIKQAVQAGEMSGSAAVALSREEGDHAPETLKAARKEARKAGKTKITRKSIAKAQSKPPSHVKRDLEAAAEAERNEAQTIVKHLDNHPDRLVIFLKNTIRVWLRGGRDAADVARVLREEYHESDINGFANWAMDIADALKAERATVADDAFEAQGREAAAE